VNLGVSRGVFDGSTGFFRCASRPGDEQIEVAGGFATAAQRTGRRHAFDAGETGEPGGDPLRRVFGLIEAVAAGAAAVILDAFADLLDLLGAHSREPGKAPGSDRFGELIDAGDLGGRPQQGDGLRAHAGELQQFQNAGPVLGQQLVAQGQRAALGDLLQVCRHALADSRDRQQLCGVVGGGGKVDGGLLGGFGGAAVAEHAKAVAAVDLQQVGRFGQQKPHRFVIHRILPKTAFQATAQGWAVENRL